MTDIERVTKTLNRYYYSYLYDNNGFNSTSFVYRFTNERMDQYLNFLKNKNNVLSIIASGDQIISLINEGTKNITGLDISIYPKYYLMLKIAGIYSLEYNEFITFFIDKPEINNLNYYKEIYFDKIRFELDNNYKEFWDYLFNNYNWNKIYNSRLFCEGDTELVDIFERIPYLKENIYNNLKNKIKNISLNFIDGDIFNNIENLNDNFDFIYLSNIYDYSNYLEYLKLLNNMPLNNNGIILSYTFYNSYYKRYRNDNILKNYKIIDKKNIDSGILIYQKN